MNAPQVYTVVLFIIILNLTRLQANDVITALRLSWTLFASQLMIADRTPSADSTLARHSRWSIVQFGRLLCYEQHDAMCSVNSCVCFRTRYNTITLYIRYAHNLQFRSHHPPPSPQPQFDPSTTAREYFLNMRVSLQAKSSPPQPPAATPHSNRVRSSLQLIYTVHRLE